LIISIISYRFLVFIDICSSPRVQDVYLTAVEVAKLAELCDTATSETSRASKQGDGVLILAYTGLRFGELTGLNVEDVDLHTRRIRVRRSITQLSGRLLEGPPKSRAGRRSVPIPERLISILERRIEGRTAGEPAIVSPKGLENWKRAVGWRSRIAELGRPTMRVHDLRHTYASLARAAGADMKLLQVTMGHASIVVTAHTYADLYDSDLDRVADPLDGLGG
jgi:integrase